MTQEDSGKMNDLSEISTRDLVNELMKREGVSDWQVDPYMKYSVFIDDGHGTFEDRGPARIIVVDD